MALCCVIIVSSVCIYIRYSMMLPTPIFLSIHYMIGGVLHIYAIA